MNDNRHKLPTFDNGGLITPANRRWWVLAAMSISLGMTFIDQTAVVVALPKIQEMFKISTTLLQWIMNTYLLTFAVFLMIGGRLGDLFQHYRIFLIGLWIFVLASIACALSPNIVWLLSGRIIQGFGAALVMPNTTVIVINTFSVEEKGKAMGIYIGSALLFLPVALLVGGFFTEYISWRLIFWINAPISIICFIICYYVMQPIPTNKEKIKIDWPGMITLIIATTSLVVALMQVNEFGWNSNLIKILLSLTVVFYIGFYYLEQRTIYPLIDFSIFRNQLFSYAAVLLFCMALPSVLFTFEAIFYQAVLGYSPAMTGLLFMPNIFCVIISAPLAGRLLDKRGYQVPILIGLCLVTTGLFLNSMTALLQNFWYLLPGIICINIGTPFVITPINTAVLSSFDKTKRGIASGVLNATRQISNSVCLGLLTTIIVGTNQRFLIDFLAKNQHNYPNIKASQLENLLIEPNKIITSVQTSQLELYKTAKLAFTSAYSMGLYVSGIFVLIATIITIILFKKLSQNKSASI